MTITVLCPNGHAVALNDPQRDHACPRCGRVLGSAEGASPFAVSGGLAARPEPPRRGKDRDEDADDDRPRKRRPRDDDDEDEDDRPRKRRADQLKAGPPRKRAVARAEPDDDDEDTDDDDGTPRTLTRKQKQMAMVRLGLLFHIIKFGFVLAGLVFGLISLPLHLFLGLVGGSIVSEILFHVTFGFGITLAPLVGTVGSVMCAMAPPRSETRGMIIVSIIFDVLAPIFGAFQLIMWFAFRLSADERVAHLQDYMLYARIACTLSAWWLIQMFLRKFSFFMRESLLASESLNVIVQLLFATVVTPTLIVGSILSAKYQFEMFSYILSGCTLAWMIFFGITFPYRQIRLLMDVREKIWVKYLKPEDD